MELYNFENVVGFAFQLLTWWHASMNYTANVRCSVNDYIVVYYRNSKLLTDIHLQNLLNLPLLLKLSSPTKLSSLLGCLFG